MTTPNPAVVVGVDGSAGSRAALKFALEEGLRRDAPVKVVTTWLHDVPLSTPLDGFAMAASLEASTDQEQTARDVQEAMLTEVLAELPATPTVERLVLRTYSGTTLVDAAEDAAVLVVGSGRKGVLTRALLGSVSEYCVRHSPVPVVVVPDPARVAQRDKRAKGEKTDPADQADETT